MQNLFISSVAKFKRALSSLHLTLISNNTNLFPLLAKDGVSLNGSKAIHVDKFQSSIQYVPGMLSDEESNLLLFLSAASTINGDIVEVGSWLGRSTIHLAEGCKVSNNGIVHAIDTFQGNPGKEFLYTAPLKTHETIFDRFKKNIKAAGLGKFVKPHKGTSESVRPLIKEKMRLIFIDGCHDYDGVLSDIKLWKNQVMKNGLLIFDDFEPTFPGVIKAVREQIINSKDYRVLFVYKALCVCQRLT
jgi:hypothetical protein